ncbi:MAG: permease prefix domain 1-containing protein [Spirochaetaceae bacterium]|jgi:MFS family permease|nr:permease prefix domain 1-containing protein [Spirochaetaceae bacterium]
MKDTKSYVDSLFSGYEETRDLADFKEELTGNLNDKIADLIKKGLDEDGAFNKAAGELGDISALADEISLKKKQEIIGEAYMDIRHYLGPRRIIAYILCGILLAFGVIVAAITYFSIQTYAAQEGVLSGVFGVLFAFVPGSIAGFTWLVLTQELPALNPLSKKRAAWYAGGTFLLSAGLVLVPLTFVSTGRQDSMISALAVLIPFALPAVGLLVFLGLTEKDRRKPWARLRAEQELQVFNDPVTAMRFGVFSGAIWIGAAALFILLGLAVSFKYSWLVFLFATALQLWVQGAMMGGKK